jgi:antibiotic biosynthesis monooxygenase (ABM) superfamily enzyme
MALMIWLSVFPTLTVLELVFHSWLEKLPMIVQTLLLSAVVVPTVVWVLMPRLHKVRGRLLNRAATRSA